MAIDDIDGDQYIPISGKCINVSTLEESIARILRTYGSLSDCRELTASEIARADLRADNLISVRQFKKGKYDRDRYPSSRKDLRVFKVSRGGGSGGNSSDSETSSTVFILGGSSSETNENKDPTVFISSPPSDITINLSNKKHFSKHFIFHTVAEGETAQAAVQKIIGKSDLSVIQELNYKSYTSGDAVYPGDLLKIENGLELEIVGEVTNSETVVVKVSGAINASETRDLGKAGVNQTVGWRIYIPVTGTGTVEITAKANSVTTNSKNDITPLHWLEIKYRDENNNPVPDMSFCITCKGDNKKIVGELKNGAAKAEGLTPGTVDIEFIHDYDKKLKQLQKDLKTELDNAIAYAKQESERLEKEWTKQPWWHKPVILGGVVLKGSMEWISDTVTGVFSIIDGVNKTGSKAIVETTKLAAHKAQLFEAYYSNDAAKIQAEIAAIDAIQTEMGESINSAKDSLESMAILASDSKTYKMLYDFPGTYFDALSFTEKTHFVFRYGIDIVLAFVGGAGIGILAVKNSAKITVILTKTTNLIKLKRYKQKVKNKDTNTLVEVKKLKVVPPVKMKQATLPCFKKGGSLNKKFKGSSKQLDKGYKKQIKNQEAGLNNMTVGEYQKGRELYTKKGRTGSGEAQKAARKNYQEEIQARLEKSIRKKNKGVNAIEIEKMASKQTDEIMSELAALHDPDLVAGGKDKVAKLGNKRINSSIGSQWSKQIPGREKGASRIKDLDKNVQAAYKKYGDNANMNVKLSVCK